MHLSTEGYFKIPWYFSGCFGRHVLSWPVGFGIFVWLYSRCITQSPLCDWSPLPSATLSVGCQQLLMELLSDLPSAQKSHLSLIHTRFSRTTGIQWAWNPGLQRPFSSRAAEGIAEASVEASWSLSSPSAVLALWAVDPDSVPQQNLRIQISSESASWGSYLEQSLVSDFGLSLQAEGKNSPGIAGFQAWQHHLSPCRTESIIPEAWIHFLRLEAAALLGQSPSPGSWRCTSDRGRLPSCYTTDVTPDS